MENISGFGLSINIVASKTFPAGLFITQFGDDVDPVDLPVVVIADKAMGLNGDLITWSKPTPIPCTVAVIAGSTADLNLAVLLEANRVGRGKIGARDIIFMNINYPAGNFINLQNGVITDGMVASSVQSSARLKTKTYQFAFENRIGG